MFSERLKRAEGEQVTRVAEEMVVKSEWRENLKHIASDMINSGLSSVDRDIILG